MIINNPRQQIIGAGGMAFQPGTNTDISNQSFTPAQLKELALAIANGTLFGDVEALSLLGLNEVSSSLFSTPGVSSGGASMKYNLFNGVDSSVLATAAATSEVISLVRRYPTVQLTVEGTGAVSARAVLKVRSDSSGNRWIPRMTIDISDTGMATDGDTLNEYWAEACLVIEDITGTNAKVYAVLEN
jgi:hypothetical protein